MEDYSIVKDEYIYIKEKAFKDIREITHSRTVRPPKEFRDNKNNNKKYTDKKESVKSDETKKEETRQLFCPLDKSLLVRISLQNIFIDYCEKCFGIWLDFGELELLLNKQLNKSNLFKNIFLRNVKNNSKDFLLCPVCKVKLKKHKNFASNTISDNCSVCGGIWLDSGEFAQIYLEKKHEESIQNILAGVIGNYINIKI
jgi:uncharacterized protein